ncbi:hypothetical protein CZP2022_179 [Vibrio phage C-ZP2022]|nr:hypothetical protein CZP2022_179 [Vibrio phage C-ZP2022]
MIDIIALYDGILPPADIEAMVHTENLFDHFTYAAHELSVIELMAVKAFENDDKAQQTYGVYYAHALRLINLFGVRTAEGLDAPLTLRNINVLLEGLSVMDDPDNLDVLQSFVTDETETEEVLLAKIIAELTEAKFGEIVEWIGQVDPALFDKMIEIAEEDSVEFDIISRARLVRDRYLRFMQDQKSGPVYEYVVQVTELPVTRGAVYEAIASQLEEINNATLAAIELVAAEIISGTKDDMLEINAKSARLNLLPQKEIVDRYISEAVEEFTRE